MPRTISANDLNSRLDEVFDWVSGHGDEVILEREGEPGVVIIPYPEYEEFKRLRKEARRRAALADLRALAAEIGDRNADLSEEEVEALADRFAHEMIDDMAAEGLIAFEQDK